MSELKVVKYIKEYGLDKTINDFKLVCKDYGNKILLKYNQIESPMSESIVQECRGLILEKYSWKVLSLSFYKFFNYGESHAAKIDWDSANILEKMDGSLISCYYDWNDKTWYGATTGTANGEGEVNNKLGTNFNDLFWDTVYNKYNLNTCLLNTDLVYMFELCTPYNIVVKPHGESSATLLGVRNRVTLKEISYKELNMVATSLGVPLVKNFDLNSGNVGVLFKTFEDMVWYEEGYVVVDGNFNRIKIKNPAYVHAHHIKSKTAEHNIITIVKTNEVEEFSATFPERKDELFKLKENYDRLISKLELVWGELNKLRPKDNGHNEKKEFAKNVFEISSEKGVKEFSSLFFLLNSGKVSSVKDFLFNYDNKKLYKML